MKDEEEKDKEEDKDKEEVRSRRLTSAKCPQSACRCPIIGTYTS